MKNNLLPSQPIQPLKAFLLSALFFFFFTFVFGSAAHYWFDNLQIFEFKIHLGQLIQMLLQFTKDPPIILTVKPYADWPHEDQFRIAIFYGISSAVSFLLSTPVFFSILLNSKSTFIRGRKMTIHAGQFNHFLRKKEGRANGIFIHPKIRISKRRETEHFLALAQPGGGKTQILNPIAQQAIQRTDKVLIFDYKGGITQSTSESALIIAPWDARSMAIDVAKDVQNRGDARSFAEAFIRESKDPMWSNGARQFLVAFIVYLQQTKPLSWTWNDLAKLLSSDYETLKSLVERFNPEGIPAVEESSKTLTSLRITLSTYMSPVYDMADAWGNHPEDKRISIREWVENQNTEQKSLILQGNEKYPALMRALIQTVLRTVHQTINSPHIREVDNKIWLFLDEFLQAGKIEHIISLLEVGRSKGLRIFLAAQDYHRIAEVYGREAAIAMLGSVGTIIFGKTSGESAKLYSQHIGKSEILRPKVSASGHALIRKHTNISSEQIRDEVDVVRSEEFGSLGQIRKLFGYYSRAIIFTGHELVCKIDWPRIIYSEIRPPSIPADWTKPNYKSSRSIASDENIDHHQHKTKREPIPVKSEQHELLVELE